VGGIISLVLGSLLLFESPDPALRVSWSVMIPVLTVICLFFAGVIALVLKAQMRKRLTGKEGMMGEEGKAVTDIHEDGKVYIKGAYWNATSDKRVEAGRGIKVVKIEGLKIKVEEIENKQGG
jgi:membrane-bound serine protease (ClpP class)